MKKQEIIMPFGDNVLLKNNGRKKFYYSKIFGWPPHIGIRVRASHINKWLQVKRRDHILEIGSNSGVHSFYLSKKGARMVVGFDVNKNSIATAKKIFIKSGKPYPLYFLSADAQNIPFNSNTFEKIICVDVLEHIDDDFKAMKEIYRVLKPGGLLVIHVPLDVRFHINPIQLSRARVKKNEIGRTHIRDGYTKKEATNIITTSGFIIDKIKVTARFFTAIAWEIDTNFNHSAWLFPFLYGVTKLDFLCPSKGNGFAIKAFKK